MVDLDHAIPRLTLVPQNTLTPQDHLRTKVINIHIVHIKPHHLHIIPIGMLIQERHMLHCIPIICLQAITIRLDTTRLCSL